MEIPKWPTWVRYIKLVLLLAMWLTFTIELAIFKEPKAPIKHEPTEDKHPETAGVILGALVLILMYVLIVFELTHRTLAAMLASSLAIGMLAIRNDRPTMEEIMSYVDVETLLLLFSMMILVALLVPSGIFDYSAVVAFRLTRGQPWPLINYLALFTILMSMVLDNVTAIILMSPVIIRICEVAHMKPVPVLLLTIFASNLGGLATPIGDPPNIMIVGNRFFQDNGINFVNFLGHMMVSTVVVLAFGWAYFRYLVFRNPTTIQYTSDDLEVLQHQLVAFEKASENMTEAYTLEEENVRDLINQRIDNLRNKLKGKSQRAKTSTDSFHETLAELSQKFVIRDRQLLYKGCVCIAYVLLMFVLHSLPNSHHLSYAWVALSGMLLFVIIAEKTDEFEHYMHQVEFATLLFFASLFILMECLSKLGLIPFIGNFLEDMLHGLTPGARLPVAIVMIIWVAGLGSAFVDNIPVTTMMMKILESIHRNRDLDLPLIPLVMTLAMAIGLGGNGTLIGATTNIVASGIAEQHGYKISFMAFFKLGFPFMIFTMIVSTVLLLLLHSVLEWNS